MIQELAGPLTHANRMASDKFDDNFDKYRNGIIIKVAKIAQRVSELQQKRLEKKGKAKNILYVYIQKLRTCHIAYVISIPAGH